MSFFKHSSSSSSQQMPTDPLNGRNPEIREDILRNLFPRVFTEEYAWSRASHFNSLPSVDAKMQWLMEQVKLVEDNSSREFETLKRKFSDLQTRVLNDISTIRHDMHHQATAAIPAMMILTQTAVAELRADFANERIEREKDRERRRKLKCKTEKRNAISGSYGSGDEGDIS